MTQPIYNIKSTDYHDNGDVTVHFEVNYTYQYIVDEVVVKEIAFGAKDSMHIICHDLVAAALVSPAFVIGMTAHWENYDENGIFTG